MGPIGSFISRYGNSFSSTEYQRYGVQITDHPYVAINMHLVVRVGTSVLQVLSKVYIFTYKKKALGDGDFLPSVHSVGVPLTSGNKDDVAWPCNIGIWG